MSLLALVMIVRNESHTLAKTLESVKPAIDRWSILDTGSTDDTPNVIRETLRELPGEVHSETFVDFATSRNRSIELCGFESEFILSLDADDALVGAKRLREFLASVKNLQDEGYFLKLAVTGCVFNTCRLFRSKARWRYQGAVHELLLPPGQDSYPGNIRTVSGVRIDHFPSEIGNKKTTARWERDVALLQEELRRDPKNARAAFYLARTLQDLQRYDEAIAAFDVRLQLEGFREEIFISKLYKARCARLAGVAWDCCVGLWLEAHEQDPSRVEPLADLTAEFSKRDDHAKCVLFARRAFELPAPKEGALFAENYDYLIAHLLGWHAYYLPDCKELGMRACKRAIELRPDDCFQDKENLQLYRARR